MFKPKTDASPLHAAEPGDPVQQARTRARHRLVGAFVLLVVGIIGFPLVFESQPRPIPLDIPIEIPSKDRAPPLVMPAERPPAGPGEPPDAVPDEPAVASAGPPRPAAGTGDDIVTESRDEGGREVAARAASAPASRPAPAAPRPVARAASAAPAAVRKAASAVEPRRSAAASASDARKAVVASGAAEPRQAGGAAPSADEAERARALLEGRAVSAAIAAESARFVVQVGAFGADDAAREARRKLEKLGVKTYTQVAQTPAGNRIRVRMGPFASRAEADAALAKARAAGLSGAVLTL